MKFNKWVVAVIGVAAIALATVSKLEAAPAANFDLTLASTLNGTTTSNAIVVISNGTVMPVQSDKDLTLTVTVTPNSSVNVLRSNAVIGIDAVWGPTANQRTTTQPMQLTVPMTSTNAIVQSFFLSRTNFYGTHGLAVDSFGVNDSTNIYAVALTEVSANWVP